MTTFQGTIRHKGSVVVEGTTLQFFTLSTKLVETMEKDTFYKAVFVELALRPQGASRSQFMVPAALSLKLAAMPTGSVVSVTIDRDTDIESGNAPDFENRVFVTAIEPAVFRQRPGLR